MSGLRQSPEPRKITPPRIESIHRLGQIGHLWGCTLCLSVYPSAKSPLDAKLIHASHCSAVADRRANPDSPDNLASGDYEDIAPTYPRQGIW